MTQIDTIVSPEGKIYLNIHDMILVFKDTIEQAKNKGIDSAALETVFVWLAKEHTKAEQTIADAKRREEHQRSEELQEFWRKYNGNSPDKSGLTTQENSNSGFGVPL